MFLLLLLLLLQGAAVETLVLDFTNRTTLSPGHLAVAAEVEMRHDWFCFECQSMATAGFCLFIFFSLKFFHSVNSYPYVFFFSQCPSCTQGHVHVGVYFNYLGVRAGLHPGQNTSELFHINEKSSTRYKKPPTRSINCN